MSLEQAKDIAWHSLSFRIIRRVRLFPPRCLLNDFLKSGVDNIVDDMDGNADCGKAMEWEPFELSEEEFKSFHSWCCLEFGPSLDERQLGATSIAIWFDRASEQWPGGFLNVDLDIESDESLAVLAEALSPEVFMLNRQDDEFRRAIFAVEFEADSLSSLGPEGCMHSFCDVIERLPGTARAVWRNAKRKSFNIGIDSLVDCYHAAWKVSNETLQRVAALGGSIEITLYRNEDGKRV